MKENKIKRNAIKIAMLGDSKVGKTAICQTFMNIEFCENNLSTIGIEKLESSIKLRNGEEIKLILWDTAGQERFHSIALNSIKTAQGVAVVFDFANRQSFENVTKWLNEIKENLNNVCVVLFGNKCDLPEEEWKVKREEAQKFAEERKINFFETSAKINKGIREGFEDVVNAAYDKFEGSTGGIQLDKNAGKNSNKKCCGGGESKKDQKNKKNNK
jgi:small GTP-binding protein